MAESGPGKIRLFNDFFGVGDALALTADSNNLGDFMVGGEGTEDAGAGIGANTALLGGVITITSGATDADLTFIGTSGLGFDVGLMGTIVMETRVQTESIAAREFFFGLSSILTLDEQLEDIVIGSSATAIVCVADLVGFYFSDELTASALQWHGIHAGGTTTDGATAANVNLGTASGAEVTVGDWQILRLEVDSNGTARWFINGDLKQTVAGAASTTSNCAALLAVAANSGAAGTLEVDYLLVKAARDWTV
jgi:hypothetical protein